MALPMKGGQLKTWKKGIKLGVALRNRCNERLQMGGVELPTNQNARSRTQERETGSLSNAIVALCCKWEGMSNTSHLIREMLRRRAADGREIGSRCLWLC